jgi:hypothetical protein
MNVPEFTVVGLGLLLNVAVMIVLIETSVAPLGGSVLTTFVHPLSRATIESMMTTDNDLFMAASSYKA